VTGTLRLEFGEPAAGYLDRLSRLRWERAFAATPGLSGTLEIRDARAVLAPGAAEALLEAAAGFPRRVVYPADSSAAGELAWSPPAVSTLRELEECLRGAARPPGARPVSPPAEYAARFVPDRSSGVPIAAPGFRVIRFRDGFGVREEILAKIPSGSRRLLDVGCGAGATAAEAARRIPGLRAEGIDRDPRWASPARTALHAFHEGDAREVLSRMRDAGEKFDVLVFADSLEHLSDPAKALRVAAELGRPGAVLVVSVPNVAGASIVGDLLAGRFDPVAAGPEDAGHVAWFTRESLRAAVEGAGFRSFEAEATPHPPGSGDCGRLAAAAAGSKTDLHAIQWVATARLPLDAEGRR